MPSQCPDEPSVPPSDPTRQRSEPELAQRGAHALVEDAQLRRMLVALLGVAVLGVLTLMVAQLLQGESPRRFIAIGCVLAGSLAAGLALRRDRIRLASQCFLVSLWVGVLLQALVFGGLDNAGLFALPVLLLATGWLLGLRAARWLTLVSVLALMAIGALVHGGWVVPPPPPPALRRVLTLCVLLGISYMAMRLLIRAHWRSIEELAALNRSLSESEATLRQLNESLEQRVAERSAALARVQQELVEAEKLSALGRLVAGLAHELNTPLGIALSATSGGQERLERLHALLQGGGGLKRSVLEQDVDAARQSSAVSLRALERAAELVRSFKQVSADQVSGWRRRFDLATVLQELADALRPQLRSQARAGPPGAAPQLQLDCPAALRLDSYPGALGQIVMNLVMNAHRHAFEGRAAGCIRLRARATRLDDGRQAVELACEDDGVGIPADLQRRVFEPFFTTQMSRGGTGLGLAVSRSLAMGLLGGRLTLDADHSPGCRFVLQLPLQAPERPERPEGPEQHEIDAASP